MWAGIPTINFQMPKIGVLWDMHKRYGEEGLDFYTAFHHVPPTTAINFYSSLVFGQSNNLVWHEIIEAPDDEAKTALLTSPEWRARARDSWEQMYPQSLLRLPERVHLQESQSGCGPIGVTLGDYIDGRTDDPHPSDALADWVLDNGFGSTLMSHMVNDSEELMTGLLKDPRAIGNISDSGAHGQMLCGIGDHVNLLTEYAGTRVCSPSKRRSTISPESWPTSSGSTIGGRSRSARRRTSSCSIWPRSSVDRRSASSTCPTARGAAPGATPGRRRRCD